MTFVNKQQKVLGEKVEKSVRRLTYLSSVKISGIVFYARTIPHLFYHLYVIADAFFQSLRFKKFALLSKQLNLFHHIVSYSVKTGVSLFFFHDVVRSRENIDVFERANRLGRHWIELRYLFYLVAPKLHTYRIITALDRKYLNYVAAYSESCADKFYIAALVLYLHKIVKQCVSIYRHSLSKRYRHRKILHRRAETVDARHRRHDYYVSALAQRACCGISQSVYLVVYRQIFFDVRIRTRNVSLRLIIIVIRYKILDPAVGEKFPKLIAKLRRQRLVVSNDKSRSLTFLYDVCHSKGLTAARYAQQNLSAQTVVDALYQLLYCLRLISARRKLAF